ncbi:glutathione S-transferase family protein [uncultured Tateyamaria sp.]|uniref:glutathione S-transferase family protein n=1 Tax=uncultured Tateyamaria sp. TaxID=455651 RepID=UPI002613A4D9|nr:glutathione S-transferase family protein [uncultured Tateyamaria sp.]
MPDLKLFVAPNTCARVPTIALEEIGVPFDTELIRTAANQQNSAEFLKLNPKGKVPTLLINGTPLTENVAILSWLNATFPDAGLLPRSNSALEALQQTADLAFFSATVHPTVTRVAMPLKFIEDKELSFEIVRPVGIEAMNKIMAMIDARLKSGPWWYGDAWSVVDGYLFWVWARILGVGYPGDAYRNIQRHHDLSIARPAIQRAMLREEKNIEILKSEGLYIPPR